VNILAKIILDTKVDRDLMVINNPLKVKHKADIVIMGGGFTGLSSAYHLIQRFPDKKIVILEGA
jgi:ribulose 1,5-bisphosphate synthetase/thiazole synthase